MTAGFLFAVFQPIGHDVGIIRVRYLRLKAQARAYLRQIWVRADDPDTFRYGSVEGLYKFANLH